MKPIFDPEELTLMTEEENKLFKKYIQGCSDYMDNKVDGVKMKQSTAQIANLTKVVQSRSATALLKFNMLHRGDDSIVTQMTKKQISQDPK